MKIAATFPVNNVGEGSRNVGVYISIFSQVPSSDIFNIVQLLPTLEPRVRAKLTAFQ